MKWYNYLFPVTNLFGRSGKNPADVAAPYLNKVEPMARENLNPYINRGAQASENVQGHYRQLSDDPYAKYNEIIGNYTPSAGYGRKVEEMLRAVRNDASAGGYGGDRENRKLMELAKSLASEDMDDYYQKITGLFGQGLQGQQHLGDQGYGASNALTGALGETYGAQASNAFQGQAQKNFEDMAKRQMFMQLLGLAGRAATSGASGGAGGESGAFSGSSWTGG